MKEVIDIINNKRRIVLDLAVSLDGFIEGINGEIDWCIMDEDMDFIKFISSVDTILYGRKSYELWRKYIPEGETSDTEKEMWEMIHRMKKYVFSKTLITIDKDVIIIKDNITEEISKLKEETGKDIWLYGGANLITTFMNLGLIDEYRLSVHPVILGTGKPLFVDIKQRQELKLVDTRRFSSDVVQLCYHPIRK